MNLDSWIGTESRIGRKAARAPILAGRYRGRVKVAANGPPILTDSGGSKWTDESLVTRDRIFVKCYRIESGSDIPVGAEIAFLEGFYSPPKYSSQ